MPVDLEQQQKDVSDREDYDSRADKLWSVYNREAEAYDRALMETWKGDMDSIIIFAGLFSAVLTAFLIETSKRLRVDPAERTNALLSQTVDLLSQISQQLGPNGSQTVVSLPQPLEAFQVTSSYLRVNVFWFMSLGFSLTAALEATLVQQWIRDYLQVFQRLSGSLGRSRMRQFLFRGLTYNYIRVLVELIPAFIHISLFLFFIGLADYLFATNPIVAITTVIIIGFSTLFYIVCSLLPVCYTKTPYQTPLSKVFWRIAQTAHLRKYSNKETEGKAVPVSVDMAKGRFQIAMSGDRMVRDAEAICWVLTTITEDREFEPLVAGIAGSFATPWGRDVWENIFTKSKEALSGQSVPGKVNGSLTCLDSIRERRLQLQALNAVQVLKIRIESLLKSCADSTFLDQQTRFTRACVCLDAVATLSLCLGDGLQFDINDDLMTQVLVYFGQEKKRRDKQAREARMSLGPTTNNVLRLENQITGTLLEIKWKCMVLVATKKILQDPDIVTAVQGVLDQLQIQRPINREVQGCCQSFMTEYDVRRCLNKYRRLNDGGQAELVARKVDKEMLKAWHAGQQLRSQRRRGVTPPKNQALTDPLSEVKTIQESLNNLLYVAQLADHTDLKIVNLVNCLMRKTGGVLEYLGSASSEWPSGFTRPGRNPIFSEIGGKVGPPWEDLSQLEPYCVTTILDNKWIMPHLLPPRMLISNLLVYASPRLGEITDPMTSSQINLNSPGLGAEILDSPEIRELMTAGHGLGPFEKQLWLLRDLRDGGTGFLIELFFTTFRFLKPMSSTPESEKLIEATLRAITEDGKSESLKQPACQRCLITLREELKEAKKNVKSNPESKKSISGFILNILHKLTNDVIGGDGHLSKEGEEKEKDWEEEEGEEEEEEEEEEGEDDNKEGAASPGTYVQQLYFDTEC